MTILYGIYNQTTGIFQTVETHAKGSGPRLAKDQGCIPLAEGDDPRTMKVDIENPLGPLLPHQREVPLETLKRKAISGINARAGRMTSRLTTQAPGMAARYARKEAQARAWLADQTQNPADFPLPYNEALATGESMKVVCQTIVRRAEETEQQDNEIEAVRRKLVVATRRAATADEITDIEQTATWPEAPQ